jgi:hypothetical protein
MVHQKLIRISCFVGAVLLLLLFYSVGGPEGRNRISATLNSLKPKKYGRVSLRQHVELAEKIWAKTIRQRAELRKDWEDRENMPL